MILRRPLLFTLFACLVVAGAAQQAPNTPKPEPQYEMTQYVMGLLRKGPAWSPTVTDETKKIQEGHMENIRKMAATGKLVVAGPITDNGDLRGVFIFQQTSIDEARAMVDQDPAVKARRLVVDLHPWYAGAGLRVNAPK